MKNKLRVVAERSRLLDIDSDIRGLGASELFEDLTPKPFLAIKQVSQDVLQKVCQIFHLDFIKHSLEGYYSLHDNHQNLNHKEKSVILMGAALFISHQHSTTQMLLKTENRLRNKMLSSIHEATEKPETELDIIQNWQENSNGHHMTLGIDIQLFLKQAGLEIQTQEQDLYLSSTELHQVSSQLVTYSVSQLKKMKGA